MPVVSMPMYDMPETRPFLRAFWTGLRGHLEREGLHALPRNMVHRAPVETLWSDSDLLLSQSCGMDVVKRHARTLRPLVTPHYGAPGCEGADYTSAVIVAERVDENDVLEMRNAVCVINGHESHSGMNALRALVAPKSRNGRFFSDVKLSGSHVLSLEMVGNGEADITAIDCVTYALVESYRPALLAGTRRIGWTDRAPGIPYVTRRDLDGDTLRRLRTGIFNAFGDPSLTEVRRALYLADIVELPDTAYRHMRETEDLAHRHGYPELR